MISLCGLALWIVVSSVLNITQRVRSLTQPWVSQRVKSDTRVILRIQKYHHKHADIFFSALSCVASVPFYIAFLPLIFWTGHCKLARQITLLMAFCDYKGNCIRVSHFVKCHIPACSYITCILVIKDINGFWFVTMGNRTWYLHLDQVVHLFEE